MRLVSIRPAAALAALALVALAACGKTGVIGSTPTATPTPVVPNVSHEFPTTTSGSHPLGIVGGFDGYLYIAESATNMIARMTTTGTFTEYAVPTGSATPYGLAAMPGSVWFTEQSGNKIGTLSSAAVFTEYAIPTPNAGPTYITPGSNGLFWFSETAANQIASIDSATGTITEYPVPIVNAGLSGLIVSPVDGELWVVAKNASAILRFDLASHTFSGPFSTLTANAGPTQIVACPDNAALCFNENTVAKLGHILPNGTVTEYPLAPATSISALTVGADSNIYFTDSAQNKFGQIKGSTYAVTEFAITTASSNPMFMVMGPDERIYFTEFGASSVGQITYF